MPCGGVAGPNLVPDLHDLDRDVPEFGADQRPRHETRHRQDALTASARFDRAGFGFCGPSNIFGSFEVVGEVADLEELPGGECHADHGARSCAVAEAVVEVLDGDDGIEDGLALFLAYRSEFCVVVVVLGSTETDPVRAVRVCPAVDHGAIDVGAV